MGEPLTLTELWVKVKIIMVQESAYIISLYAIICALICVICLLHNKLRHQYVPHLFFGGDTPCYPFHVINFLVLWIFNL